jgi:putative FmdB family regulatory protein
VPIYEYECESCHHRREVIQRFSDKPLKRCQDCGGPLRKVLSPPALVFKGTGWYVTDYGRGGQKADGNGKNGGAKHETPSASTETKPEAKKDSKSD